jgi:hypothetical protein
MAHKTLKKAITAKNDEFYTQLTDIEKELRHYKDQFKDKIVYCNADDPFESNFFKYFASNFNLLGLKKLIATSYAGSPIVGKQLSFFDIEGVKNENKKEPMKIEINEVKDFNNDGAINIADVEYLLKHDKNSVKALEGSGDFRSHECVEILKEADIVVTNPPFSLFREYVAQLEEYNKKFLIIGNTNAITYKETFALIKENKLRTGYTNFNVGMFFVVPDDWKKFHHIDENGKKIARVSTSCWFTNLDVKKHKEDLILFKTYNGNESEYPKYDNYDAIEVSQVANIPMDYAGQMGVPITFVDKYNPDQFEIIGFTHRNDPYNLKTKIYTKEDADNFNDLNGSPIIKNGNQVKFIYMRIIIRNKKL